MQGTHETRVWSLGQEDPLEEEMTTYSSILDWKIQRTENLVGYSPKGPKESDVAKDTCTVHTKQYLRNFPNFLNPRQEVFNSSISD